MVNRLSLRQPQASKHLRVLTDAGRVDVRADAQRRIYRLRPAPLRELEMCCTAATGEGGFHRLDTLLDEIKTKKKKRASTKR
jgi:DNA-binding transcriptional ArsR family regulator